VMRCMWGCLPTPFPIVYPPKPKTLLPTRSKSSSPTRTYHALTLENFDGMMITDLIDIFSQSGPQVPDIDARKQILGFENVKGLYNAAKNAAFSLWDHDWVHRDFHIDNLIANPQREEVRILNVQEALHFTETELTLMEWMDLIAEDFQILAYSFGKKILMPHARGVSTESFDTIYPIMEHFDKEFTAVMTYIRSIGRETRLNLLPPRIQTIIIRLRPPLPPPKSQDVMDLLSSHFQIASDEQSISLSEPSQESFTGTQAWFFLALISILFLFGIYKKSKNISPSEIYLLSNDKLSHSENI